MILAYIFKKFELQSFIYCTQS